MSDADDDREGRGDASSTSAPSGERGPSALELLTERLAKLPSIGRKTAEKLAYHLLRASQEEALALADAIRHVKERIGTCPVCGNLAEILPCGICADASRDRTRICVVEQPRDLIALEKTGVFNGLYHILSGRIAPLEGIGADELTINRLVARLQVAGTVEARGEREEEQNSLPLFVDDPSVAPPGDADATTAPPSEDDSAALAEADLLATEPGLREMLEGVHTERVEEVVIATNPDFEGDGTALYLREALAPFDTRVTRIARGIPQGASIEFVSAGILSDAMRGRQAVDGDNSGDHPSAPRRRSRAT